jgi:predicted nucleic acid-binding protein
VNFLIDTNVASDITKPQPNARVLGWYGAQPPEALFISALTLGEVRKGILLLDEGARRRSLFRWLQDVLEPSFEGRILNADLAVAHTWAEMQAKCRRQGRILPTMDSLIAATALTHGFTVATRNTADFMATGVPVVNPWEA